MRGTQQWEDDESGEGVEGDDVVEEFLVFTHDLFDGGALEVVEPRPDDNVARGVVLLVGAAECSSQHADSSPSDHLVVNVGAVAIVGVIPGTEHAGGREEHGSPEVPDLGIVFEATGDALEDFARDF